MPPLPIECLYHDFQHYDVVAFHFIPGPPHAFRRSAGVRGEASEALSQLRADLTINVRCNPASMIVVDWQKDLHEVGWLEVRTSCAPAVRLSGNAALDWSGPLASSGAVARSFG